MLVCGGVAGTASGRPQFAILYNHLSHGAANSNPSAFEQNQSKDPISHKCIYDDVQFYPTGICIDSRKRQQSGGVLARVEPQQQHNNLQEIHQSKPSNSSLRFSSAHLDGGPCITRPCVSLGSQISQACDVSLAYRTIPRGSFVTKPQLIFKDPSFSVPK